MSSRVYASTGERDLLFSFVGARTHRCRDSILSLRHPRAQVQQEEGFRRWEADDKRGYNKAKKLGHEIIRIPDAEEARWRKAAQPAYDDWIKEMNDKGLPGRQMVEDAERLVAKYKAASKNKK